jgi:hypothetical protein
MHDEMRLLLNAYLDGELHGARLQQLQDHLGGCAECRQELAELRRLSTLLHEDPAPQLVPVDRFVANLTLSLPRRPAVERSRRPASWVWGLVPAGLLFAWIIVQAAFVLGAALSIAGRADLLGNASTMVSGVGEHSLWFDALSGLFGSQPGAPMAALSFFDQLGLVGSGLLAWVFWQAVIFMLYWAWLAVWWWNRRSRDPQGSAGVS